MKMSIRWQALVCLRYTLEPWLNNGELDWREGAEKSLDSNVIASFEQTFLSSWWDKSVKR